LGTPDHLIHTLIAIFVAVFYFTGIISGTPPIILGVVAVTFSLTSFAGTCALYLPFGLSTNKKTDTNS
jgi:hypothetical protein